jgi:nitrite reductase/ring-hydroxylating ferredoxin subunit
MAWLRLGSVEAFPAGTLASVKVAGRQLAICHDDGEFFAVENACPHKGGPLSQGWLKGATVTCPWHRFRFDLRRACSVTNEAMQVRTYPVQVEDGVLKVDIG